MQGIKVSKHLEYMGDGFFPVTPLSKNPTTKQKMLLLKFCPHIIVFQNLQLGSFCDFS